MSEIDSKQRKQLRGLAHALEPVVHVGKEGITAALVAQVDRALAAHELIKVRILAGKEEKRAVVDALCAATGAAEAGTVGHVAILFRRQRDPERRKIRLVTDD